MPNLEAQFFDADLISSQWHDMEQAICYLREALCQISEGGIKNERQFATETINSLSAIFVPLEALRLG